MANSLRIAFGAFILLAFAVILILSYGGDLMKDIALRDAQLAPHPTALVTSAKCKNYYMVVSACSIQYEDVSGTSADKIQVRPELSSLMFGSVAGERVVLMRPASGAQVVTSNTGMAHLTNRMMTLLVLAGFCVVMPLAMAIKLLGVRAPAAAIDRSLTSDSVDAAIAKRLLAQSAAPAPSNIAPPAYNRSEPARTRFGRRSLAS